jgi:long-chain acyl-CoA synthetase
MSWTVAGIVRGHGEGRPDAPAITYEGRTTTWAELDARTNQVAQALAGEGVGEQDRIAFIDKNGPEYFEFLFGGAKLNAVTVGVNWRLAPPEMEYTINDAEARVLVVGSEFLSHLEQFEPGLQTVKKIVVIGDHDKHEPYDAWVSKRPATDPGIEARPEDVAMQLYTSGTTGLPKGAMLTNSNLGTMMPAIGPMWRFDAGSVNLVAMPLFHIGGSGWALVGMTQGCRSVIVREIVPQELLDTLEHEKITNAFLVPAVLQFLTMLPDCAARDFSSLRAIVYGASPITNEVLTRSLTTFRTELIQVYGLTETTGAITQLDAADHDPDGPRAHLLRSAGKPYPHVEMKIVDESGNERPRGSVGELWTRNAQNMKGYWNKPEATDAVLTSDGWFKTGDAGYMDDDGYVFLTDRIKDMIVSGGENIYPIEVENALSGHPAVADIAVIGVPDERWGETVKAIVVLKDGATLDPDELIAYARERLAGYKIPRSVDFATELPRNPSGKLLKRILREPYWKDHDRRIH